MNLSKSVCFNETKNTNLHQRDKPRNHKHLSQKFTSFSKLQGVSSYFKAYCKILNFLNNVLSNHQMGHLGQKNKAHT